MTQPDDNLMAYLAARRSIPAVKLAEPAPSGDDLDRILTVAARVPDHGKLAPWRFIVIAGDDRTAFVDRVMAIWRKNNPDASAEDERVERGKREAGPLLVVIVSRTVDHPKIPAWEQELSAGAVCMNFVHACNASGYVAQWLTAWLAFDTDVADLLGLEEGDRIAGFMHVGTPTEAPVERDRPDLSAIVSRWQA